MGVQQRNEAQANGSDQEAPQEEEGRSRQREAGCCEDPPEEHGGCPRDDRLHCWCLQREGLHPGGDQARDDRPLPGRVLHLLQACQARKTRYWSHPLLQIHPSEVKGVVLFLCNPVTVSIMFTSWN